MPEGFWVFVVIAVAFIIGEVVLNSLIYESSNEEKGNSQKGFE